MPLATPILTNISTKAQIYFSESPMHFNFQNALANNNIQKVTVEVYVWRGLQTADLPTTPAFVFSNVNKISPSDDYITININNEIKSYIQTSNLNKHNPQWAYNTLGSSASAGEGVFFHIVYKVDSEAVQQLGTYFATMGYRYNYEQVGSPYTTYNDAETFRRYANGIRYDIFSINLTTDKATAHSGIGSMITQTVIEPANREIQTGVSCIIVYLNRLGLWDIFTPFGKVVETEEIKRDSYEVSYRNPLTVNNQLQHLQGNDLPKGVRKWSINTSLLDERNNYQIKEINQSSKIYLVVFQDKLKYTAVDAGITVDTTAYTVDDTNITVDADVVTLLDVGFYKEFIQIPVKKTNNTFVKKTKLNDKSSISYTIELEEVNNLINDI